MLKQAIDWKSKSLVELVSILEDLVTGQHKELRSALIGTGEFRLAETHRQFQISKTEWVSKTDAQRKKLYGKFRHFVPMDSKYMTSSDGRTEIVAPRMKGRKPGQTKRKVNERTTTKTNKKMKN